MSDMTPAVPPELAQARERFLAMVSELRPELHRYCARLTGSVIEGEDIVQEALARGFYAISLAAELPPLRPWLFRIAHNAAMDFLKSHARRYTEPHPEPEALAADKCEDAVDPAVVRAALSRFVALPVVQRSAVILKDVLGHSLEEAAATMDTSVPAVKAALVRGRATLRATPEDAPRPARVGAAAERELLDRYASLFNARDWDAVRALVGADCRLDLVSRSQRRGRSVGAYYSNYEKVQGLRVAVVGLEGRPALAVFEDAELRPAYFILLEWAGGRIASIRDYRYVRYVADEAVSEDP